MNAEEYITGNYRSKYNPLLDKHNRRLEQYSFDDVIEFCEAYAEHKIGKCHLIDNYSMFGLLMLTSCCKIGPITNENYCPGCGRKIVKK